MPPTRKASERFLSIEEARRLLVAGTDRDQMIVLLFMVVRLRPSELFALRVNDLSPGLLRIDEADVPGEPIKSQTKTEDSAADLPLPAGLELALRDYIRRHSLTDLIFPSETGTVMSHDNYLDRVLKKLGVLAGIDVFTDVDGSLNSKLNHQVLRRTTATHFQKYAPIKATQRMMRHSDAATTLKHYQKTLKPSVIKGVSDWYVDLTEAGKKSPAREKNLVAKRFRKVD